MTTPPSSVGGSLVRKPEGEVLSRVWLSRSLTPSRPSTVLRFQVKAIRSRQYDVGANSAAALSTSRAVSACSKSASQASARSWTGSVVGASSVWVM